MLDTIRLNKTPRTCSPWQMDSTEADHEHSLGAIMTIPSFSHVHQRLILAPSTISKAQKPKEHDGDFKKYKMSCP